MNTSCVNIKGIVRNAGAAVFASCTSEAWRVLRAQKASDSLLISSEELIVYILFRLSLLCLNEATAVAVAAEATIVLERFFLSSLLHFHSIPSSVRLNAQSDSTACTSFDCVYAVHVAPARKSIL